LCAIEDHRGAFAPRLGELQNLGRDGLRKNVAHVGATLFRADQRAVVDDHGERRVDFLGDGQGEIVAAAGDEGHFDAAFCGFGDGGAVGFGNLPAAVEKRAVNIESDEAYRHSLIVSRFQVSFVCGAPRWLKRQPIFTVLDFAFRECRIF
jgi:hypothetical protein